jgi:hypothetical protein
VGTQQNKYDVNNNTVVSVEKMRKVSYADAVRGTGTHPESAAVDDAVHWHVVKSRKKKERNVRLSASHSLE